MTCAAGRTGRARPSSRSTTVSRKPVQGPGRQRPGPYAWRPMSRLLTLLLGLAVAATSCAAGGGSPATSDTPDRGLAGRPTPLGADTGAIPPPVSTSSRPRTRTPSAGRGDGGASGASPSAGARSTSTAGPARSAPYRGFADLADSVN